MYNKYYINLERCPERKQFMEKSYDNIIRIEAYDGKKLSSYDDILTPKSCIENPGQLACSLSHIKAIIHAYKNTDKNALILEDDTSNKYASKWKKSIEEVIKGAPSDCECIQFFCSNIYSIKYMYEQNTDYYKWNSLNWSTGCYYINRKGMKKIHDLFYKKGKINLGIKLHNYVADDGALYNNMITYTYTKPMFINNMSSTTIQHKPGLEQQIHNFIKHHFENNETNMYTCLSHACGLKQMKFTK
jgi:GR25 family glycosyltransferase involved in LPS biosynthesis